MLAGLDPVNREISELILLHEFYGADLAAILGAPRNQAHVLAKRSRLRLERSLGVLLVARADREHCITGRHPRQAGRYSNPAAALAS